MSDQNQQIIEGLEQELEELKWQLEEKEKEWKVFFTSQEMELAEANQRLGVAQRQLEAVAIVGRLYKIIMQESEGGKDE
jgi:hypothetical protein